MSGRCIPADSCLLAGLGCNNSAVTVTKGLTHGVAAAEKTPQQDRTSNGAAPEGLAGTIQHMTQWPQTLIVGCSCALLDQLHMVISWHCHDCSGIQVLHVCADLCWCCTYITADLAWSLDGHRIQGVSMPCQHAQSEVKSSFA